MRKSYASSENDDESQKRALASFLGHGVSMQGGIHLLANHITQQWILCDFPGWMTRMAGALERYCSFEGSCRGTHVCSIKARARVKVRL